MNIPVVRRLRPPSILFMPSPFFIVFMFSGERARRTEWMSRNGESSVFRCGEGSMRSEVECEEWLTQPPRPGNKARRIQTGQGGQGQSSGCRGRAVLRGRTGWDWTTG